MLTRAIRTALSCAASCLLALVVIEPSVAQQASAFSADVVHRSEGGDVPAARLRVSSDKVRLETTDLPDGYFIVDGTTPSATFVKPAAGVYMDARKSSPLTQIFVPVDAGDPCPAWHAMARVAGETDHGPWQCARLGEERLDGRSAIIYRAAIDGVERMTGWIDPQLNFPLQIKLPDGAVFAARAIQMQAQAPELFAIPAGFRKFDPDALLQRVKQSDVWVETH